LTHIPLYDVVELIEILTQKYGFVKLPIDKLCKLVYNRDMENIVKPRASVGEGILPRIHAKSASAFEDAFLILIEFGEQTFKHYVSLQPYKTQQEIYNVFRLFALKIRERCGDIK